jgi:type II secretory pathway pseudopilin PulG
MLNLRERGDTIIEVMFAVTVFSLVIVGSLTIMNQGTAAAQRSLEVTLARQQIDAQADTLRFMHDSYVAQYRPDVVFDAADTSPAAEWSRMIKSGVTVSNADAFDADAARCSASPTKSFVVNPRTARFVEQKSSREEAKTYPQLVYRADGSFAAEGIWVQAVRSPSPTESYQNNVGFIDFHIRACWDGPGNSPSIRTGTIVRLYEPR